jgi:hypothetical protein
MRIMSVDQWFSRCPAGSDAIKALLASALVLASCGGKMTSDGGVPDAGDAGLSDGGAPDAGDAGVSDGGQPDSGLPDSGCLAMTPSQHLSIGYCLLGQGYCFGSPPPDF